MRPPWRKLPCTSVACKVCCAGKARLSHFKVVASEPSVPVQAHRAQANASKARGPSMTDRLRSDQAPKHRQACTGQDEGRADEACSGEGV